LVRACGRDDCCAVLDALGVSAFRGDG
jgi:hypothetical protein